MNMLTAFMAMLLANSRDEDEDEIDGYTSISDFPEPDFSTPFPRPDIRACLQNAIQYAKLADRAYECGFDALGKQYEALSKRWYTWYEIAKDDGEDDEDYDGDEEYEEEDEDDW